MICTTVRASPKLPVGGTFGRPRAAASGPSRRGRTRCGPIGVPIRRVPGSRGGAPCRPRSTCRWRRSGRGRRRLRPATPSAAWPALQGSRSDAATDLVETGASEQQLAEDLRSPALADHLRRPRQRAELPVGTRPTLARSHFRKCTSEPGRIPVSEASVGALGLVRSPGPQRGVWPTDSTTSLRRRRSSPRSDCGRDGPAGRSRSPFHHLRDLHHLEGLGDPGARVRLGKAQLPLDRVGIGKTGHRPPRRRVADRRRSPRSDGSTGSHLGDCAPGSGHREPRPSNLPPMRSRGTRRSTRRLG